MFAQIQQLDQNLGRADEQINLANLRLAQVEYEQKVNRHELIVAKHNLDRSRQLIAKRLVSLYTTPQPSTLDLILGATSMSDLLTRIDNADRLSSIDGQVIGQVRRSRRRSCATLSELAARARVRRTAWSPSARPARQSIANQLGERQRLLNSIQGEISTLEAAGGGPAAPDGARRAGADRRGAGPAVGGAGNRGRGERRHARRRERAPRLALRQPGRLDRDVVPRHPVRLGRRRAGRLRLLGARHVLVRAARHLAAALVVRDVELRHARCRTTSSSPATSSSSTDSGTSGLYIGGGEFVERAVHGRRACRVDSSTAAGRMSNYVGARRIL